MPAEGQLLDEHLLEKYGATPEHFAATRQSIRDRGEALDFVFRMERRDRIYNTFDCHRLLHWAGEQGRQLELKMALFRLYFTEGQNPGATEVLLGAVADVGLDVVRATAILASDEFAQAVREREGFYTSVGIHSVPAVIINDQHLISGGQPVELFERALRQIAAGA